MCARKASNRANTLPVLSCTGRLRMRTVSPRWVKNGVTARPSPPEPVCSFVYRRGMVRNGEHTTASQRSLFCPKTLSLFPQPPAGRLCARHGTHHLTIFSPHRPHSQPQRRRALSLFFPGGWSRTIISIRCVSHSLFHSRKSTLP